MLNSFKMKSLFKHSILPVLITYLVSCDTTNTGITANWKAPSAEKSYHNVLVMALTDKALERSTVETVVAATLGENGVHATGGIENFPAGFKASDADKQALIDEVKKTNSDAILTVSMLKNDAKNRYVASKGKYEPLKTADYNATFYGYYKYWYPYVYNSAYHTDDHTYFLETNLYDADTERLVWSAQSVTYEPVMLPDFTKEYAELMVNRMKTDGILGAEVLGNK
jgi:hypothetical protein